MTVLWSLLGFLLVIGILVTIHEWGHFQVARWFHIKVVRFSIGFGRPLWRRQIGETELQVAAVPFGGYVKFVDEAEGPVVEEDLPRAFNRQSVYKRFAVVAAGPVVNLLFAWLVFSAIYIIGVQALKPMFNAPIPETPLAQVVPEAQAGWLITQVDGKPVDHWMMVREGILKALVADRSYLSLTLQELEESRAPTVVRVPLDRLQLDGGEQDWLTVLGFQPIDIPVPAVVGSVSEQSPAQSAGLIKGDRVLAIDERPVHNWQDVVDLVAQRPDQAVVIQFQRDGSVLNRVVHLSHKTAETGEEIGVLGIGVQVSKETLAPYYSVSQYGVLDALSMGAEKCVDLTVMTLTMLKKMVLGEASLSNLSGPVSIAHFSGQALESGLISFLGLLGLLSLSLGVLNLLPIPVLDGGHLVYYTIEMIKGSPVSESAMVLGQKIGLLLILSLTILAITNDILRITHG